MTETVPLSEKYALEKMPLALAGKEIELYGIANWDAFVERLAREGEEGIRNVPFWVKVWEASIALADYLIRLDLDKETEILEIGAGMGATGLLLGAFGFRVTITDYEADALELLRMNARHNGLDNVTVRKLDWNRPELPGRYDVICGSEIIYNEASVGPVITLLARALSPGGSIYLAHDVKRKCMARFFCMIPGKFEMENIPRTMRGEDEVHRVLIHALRPLRWPGSKPTHG